MVRLVPVAIVIAFSLTALESFPTLRIALLVPLVPLALKAPAHLWRYVASPPIGLFVLAMALSVLWSQNRPQSVLSLGAWSLEMLAALAAIGVAGVAAARYVAAFLKVFLVLSVAVAVLVPSIGRMELPGSPWQGIFVHKNSLGSVAASALVLFAVTGRPGHRLRWMLLSGLCLVASQSKAALVAGVVSLAVVATARVVYTRRSGRRPLPAVVFYGFLLLEGFVVWQMSGLLLDLLNRSDDLSGRTDLWSAIIDYGSRTHWFGSGIGAQIHDGSDLAQRIELVTGSALGTTHNGFLVAYLGLGIVGLVMLFAALARILVTIELARRGPASNNQAVLVALGLTTCYLVLNLAEDRLINRSGWFFLLLGVLQLVHHRERIAAQGRGVPASRPAAPSG